MKKFLQKVFRLNTPGKSAFESLVLFFLGAWLLGTLFFLSHGIFVFGSFCLGVFRFGIDNIHISDYPWQLYLVLLLLLLVIHCLVKQISFWCSLRREKCTSIFWKWFAVMILLWGGTAASVTYIVDLVTKNYYHDGCFLEYLKTGAWSLPYWCVASVLLLAASVLASGKVFSVIGGYSFRENFTIPVKILVVLVIAVYFGLRASALFVRNRVRTEIAQVGKNFGRPLTIEAFQKFVFGNRKVDEKFWQEIDFCNDPELNTRELEQPFAEFSPTELAAWRKKFFSSPQYAKFDRMISEELPAYPWKIKKYELSGTLLPDFLIIGRLADLQVWNIRFALERGDREAVVAALKRLDNLSDYLSKVPFLIGMLRKNAVDITKIRAIENVLAAQILTGDDLLYVKQRSCVIRENMASLERNAIWSETLGGFDFITGFVNTGTTGDGQAVVPLKNFFNIFPQGWLVYECNRLNFLRVYSKVSKLHDVPDIKISSVFNYFAYSMIPAVHSSGNRNLQNILEQEAIRFFIDQELYRLEHGKLPENQTLPVDLFCQKPMKYIQDNVTVKKEIFRSDYRPAEIKEYSLPGRQLIAPSNYKYRNITITIPDKVAAAGK
ncbi:MAG: hypothetical protein E7042_03075 [Lentisphaerae bacterium]|nr:hypothetical protein [Lentisphaerota bacterium]